MGLFQNIESIKMSGFYLLKLILFFKICKLKKNKLKLISNFDFFNVEINYIFLKENNIFNTRKLD